MKILRIIFLLAIATVSARAQNPLQGKPTASSPAGDDWLYLGGTTNSVRKLSPLYYLPSSYLDTDGTLAANSDVKVASQKAVRTYLLAYAPNASPTFTGTVTIPTASTSDKSTKAASTAFVKSQTIVIGFGADGGGSVITTARLARVISSACTITGWRLVADQSGSITVDLRKGTPSGGTVTTSTITASATPALSSQQVVSSTTLTSWTTTLAAGDVLEMVVTGTPSAVTRFALSVDVTLN